MTKKEFSVGDRVAWNYGIGKGKGHILEKVTKTTKFAGKNFKASPEEPKYLIKSDKGKELFRNPETLEMLKEDVGDDNGDVEEMDHEAEDAQEVAHEKDDDPTADIEGTEKKDEVKEALASQDRELEAEVAEVSKDKEIELGGEPLQQMPAAEKNVPSSEDKDDSADLSKVEAQLDGPLKRTGVDDVKIEEAKEKSSNGTTTATTEADAPHGLPHETVPQPDLDAVK